MRRNRIIQFSLITIALGLIFFTYYSGDKDKTADFDKNISGKVSKLTEETSNIIENVNYTGSNAGVFFSLNADTAEIKHKDPNISHLESVFVVIKLSNLREIHIRSDKAIYDKATNDAEFWSNVIVTENENIITCDNLNLFMSKNLITAYNNLNVKYNEIGGLGLLTADKVDIDILKNTAKIFMFQKNDKVQVKYKN